MNNLPSCDLLQNAQLGTYKQTLEAAMHLGSVDLKITDPRLKELDALPRRATDGSAGYDVAACLGSGLR